MRPPLRRRFRDRVAGNALPLVLVLSDSTGTSTPMVKPYVTVCDRAPSGALSRGGVCWSLARYGRYTRHDVTSDRQTSSCPHVVSSVGPAQSQRGCVPACSRSQPCPSRRVALVVLACALFLHSCCARATALLFSCVRVPVRYQDVDITTLHRALPPAWWHLSRLCRILCCEEPFVLYTGL